MDDSQDILLEKETLEIYARWTHEFSHRIQESFNDDERTILARAYMSASLSFFMCLSEISGNKEFVDISNNFFKTIQETIIKKARNDAIEC